MGNTILAYPDRTRDTATVITGPDVGADMASNGSFATDTGWTKDAGWTISGGVASVNGADKSLFQSVSGAVVGRSYLVTFTITSITSGSIMARTTGTNWGTPRTDPGTYTETVTLTADTNIGLRAVGSTVASVDNVVITGTGWSSNLPLANLKDKVVSKTARSVNALAASTYFTVDLGTARDVKVLSAIAHNISAAGTIRVRGYSDAGLTNVVLDTGTLNTWPTGFTAEDVAAYPKNWTLVLPIEKTARYWKWEITDTANPAGYVELGRAWMGPAWSPTVGIVYGADIGYESRTTVTESLGGVQWGDNRAPRRVTGITFPALADGDERAKAMMFQKTIDVTGEVLYVEDVNHTVRDMLLYAFPANVRQMSRIRAAAYGVNEMPLELAEIL